MTHQYNAREKKKRRKAKVLRKKTRVQKTIAKSREGK
jgi:hypothetical protein